MPKEVKGEREKKRRFEKATEGSTTEKTREGKQSRGVLLH